MTHCMRYISYNFFTIKISIIEPQCIAIFVPFFLVGSYAPFVPIQWLPVLGIVALVPVAAILVLYNERGKEDQRKRC